MDGRQLPLTGAEWSNLCLQLAMVEQNEARSEETERTVQNGECFLSSERCYAEGDVSNAASRVRVGYHIQTGI